MSLPAPFNLRAEAANGKATLYWSVDRPENVLISGYNIYLSEAPDDGDTIAWKTAPGQPHNDFPYPGDTDGEIGSESYQLEGLTDGRPYVAQVRTVGPGGALSAPSNVVVFESLGQGEFVIGANHLAGDGGFNLETGAMVPGRDPRNDLYLYVTRERVGLSSPSRLGAGLRKTEFIINGENAVPLETSAIETGDTITLRTRYGIAMIAIEEIIGRYPDVRARISYRFRPSR